MKTEFQDDELLVALAEENLVPRKDVGEADLLAARERIVPTVLSMTAESARHRPAYLRPVLAGLIVAALVGLSFTPPGRAITGQVGEWVGIGGPATIDHSDDPSLVAEGNQIVIAKAETADGARFEIVAFEGDHGAGAIARRRELEEQIRESQHAIEDRAGDAPPAPALPPVTDPGTCVTVDWIDRPNPRGGGICIDGPQTDPLHITGTTDSEGRSGPAARLYIQGLTTPEVTRVEVTYENADGEQVVADSVLGRLVGPLAEKIGAGQQFGFFVAFIPEDDVGPGGYYADVMTTVQATAYGENGDEIKSLDWGSAVAQQIARRERQQSDPALVESCRKTLRQNPGYEGACVGVVEQAESGAAGPGD